jgi:hypothetical protein
MHKEQTHQLKNRLKKGCDILFISNTFKHKDIDKSKENCPGKY